MMTRFLALVHLGVALEDDSVLALLTNHSPEKITNTFKIEQKCRQQMKLK
jgi:hypothetical protein